MPFTFAHPAAVLPLARRGLVFSALVVGSMAPDFEYFLTLSTRARYGHTLPGIFLFSLPAGLAGLWLFHTVLKKPLLHLLPLSHQQKLMPFAGRFDFGPPQRFILIALSVLLGVFTHIAWDSFTHFDGWGTEHFPFLGKIIFSSRFGTIHIYQLMQYGCTFLGLAVLAVAYRRWLQNAPVPAAEPLPQFSLQTKLRIVLSILAGAILVTLLYAWAFREAAGNPYLINRLFNRLVVAGIGAMLWGFTFYSIWWQWVYRPRVLNAIAETPTR